MKVTLVYGFEKDSNTPPHEAKSYFAGICAVRDDQPFPSDKSLKSMLASHSAELTWFKPCFQEKLELQMDMAAFQKLLSALHGSAKCSLDEEYNGLAMFNGKDYSRHTFYEKIYNTSGTEIQNRMIKGKQGFPSGIADKWLGSAEYENRDDDKRNFWAVLNAFKPHVDDAKKSELLDALAKMQIEANSTPVQNTEAGHANWKTFGVFALGAAVGAAIVPVLVNSLRPKQ